MFNSLPDTRLSVAAGAFGLAQAYLDDAINYCNERSQFGKLIGQFQINQVLIADVATAVEAARLLVYRAACQKDEGSKNNALECSYAKKFAAEVAVQAANANMTFTVLMDIRQSMRLPAIIEEQKCTRL